MSEILLFRRSYGLCVEAAQTLCCAPGDIRARLRILDPEFLVLHGEDFPEASNIRVSFIELKKLLTRFDPKGDEGRVAATISRSKKPTLVQAAQKIWDIHREFSHYMNHKAS